MPCYQVQTVSVEFHAKNRELLDKAIKELGWRVSENSARAMVVYPTNSYNALTLDLQTGHAAFADGQQSKLNELKRAYSTQAVKLAAKLGGWQVKNLSNNKGLLMKGVL